MLTESSWDDVLPVRTDLGNPSRYTADKFGIYKEPDNEQKAESIATKLEWGDVIILASKTALWFNASSAGSFSVYE